MTGPPREASARATATGALAWLFLLPSVVYIVALVALPVRPGHRASAFSDVTAGDPSFDFVGLANFRRIFDDPVFWQALRNTFVFTGVSMVAHRRARQGRWRIILVADFRGKWLVRFLVLLPWTTPAALGADRLAVDARLVYCPLDWILRQLGLLDGATCTGWASRAWRWRR